MALKLVHNGGEILSEAVQRFDPLWVTYRYVEAEPDVGARAGVEIVAARHAGSNVVGYLTEAELDLLAQECMDEYGEAA